MKGAASAQRYNASDTALLEVYAMTKDIIVALDVHKKFSWVVTMCTKTGDIIYSAKLSHNGRLQNFLRSIPQSTVVLEMSGTWWLIDLLEGLGHNVKALHPQAVRLIAQSAKKTDKNDAEILAHIARLGPCPCVWLPPKDLRELRALLRFRIFLVRRCTSIKNHIHYILRANGWQYPPITDIFGKTGREYLRGVELPEGMRWQMDRSLDMLEQMESVVAEIDKKVKDEVKNNENAQLLMSMPGIGEFGALLLTSEIGDVGRFSSAKKMCAYFGLVPRVRQSGERCYRGRISKEGNSHIRWYMVQAAWVAVRVDERIGAFYGRLQRRKGSKIALVATARKMLTIVWWMLKERKRYERLMVAKERKVRLVLRRKGAGQP